MIMIFTQYYFICIRYTFKKYSHNLSLLIFYYRSSFTYEKWFSYGNFQSSFFKYLSQ